MYLAKNLKYLRLKNGFSQDYLADNFGYKSYTTIQKWEMGTSEPSVSVLNKLSEIYNIDMDSMYTQDLSSDQDLSITQSKSIPLLGTIAAGVPILAQENIEDYFNLDSKIKADFALRIKGDSMINVGIQEQDIVFIRKQECLENGEIGAILIDGEATLKKFHKDNGTIVLQAENKAYAPMIYSHVSLDMQRNAIAKIEKDIL